jgi:hypothetical protein
MGLDDPLATVERIPDVSAADKEMISSSNAAKLLKL